MTGEENRRSGRSGPGPGGNSGAPRVLRQLCRSMLEGRTCFLWHFALSYEYLLTFLIHYCVYQSQCQSICPAHNTHTHGADLGDSKHLIVTHAENVNTGLHMLHCTRDSSTLRVLSTIIADILDASCMGLRRTQGLGTNIDFIPLHPASDSETQGMSRS